MNQVMGITRFAEELENMGFTPTVRENSVVFDYEIPCGRFQGQTIRLGFEVPPDFNVNPPSGPHLSPLLIPINGNAGNHPERCAESNFKDHFEGEWEYWSRPIHHWQKTKRNVKTYLHYMEHLFATQ